MKLRNLVIARGKHFFRIAAVFLLAVALLLPAMPVTAVPPITIVERAPGINAQNVAAGSDIIVEFSENINGATVTAGTFNVVGSYSGRIAGGFSTVATIVTFNPASDFHPGELVIVTLTTGIQDSTDGDTLAGAVTWQFTVAVTDGYGSFPTSNDYGTATQVPYELAYGDVDNDGDLDLVMGNYSGQQNVVYLNNGDGTYAAAGNNFGTGTDWTHALALGDMDNDGFLDIVVGNITTQNVIYYNDGDGTFDTTSTALGGVDGTKAIALGDMDGDGNLDIAVGNSAGVANRVYLNNGAGGFLPLDNAFGTAAVDTFSVALGDMNRDGILDIVCGVYMGQNAVCFGDGDGTFDTTVINFGPGDDDTETVVLGDLDGDGDLDIVAGNNNNEASAVYLNNGTGTVYTQGVFWASGKISSVQLGDMDNDGDLDIVTGHYFQQNYIHLNNGDGTFTTHLPFAANNEWVYALAVGDATGDGALDIALGKDGAQNKVYVNSPVPEINLKQGATDIADGGAYDFGNHNNGTNTDVIFTIENTGAANLTITLDLALAGANADQFSIQAQPVTPVAAAGTTTFTVRFTPTSAGVKTATIAIVNNDSNETPYDLTITGTGVVPPAGGDAFLYTYHRIELPSVQKYLPEAFSRTIGNFSITAPDGSISLTIPAGTLLTNANGGYFSGDIVITANESPPAPPEGLANITGPYGVVPSGVTFSPAITLALSYDPSNLPEGTSEDDLVLFFYDEAAGTWVASECVINQENHSITASAGCFTTFAVMISMPILPQPGPAVFSLSDFTIEPDESTPGKYTVTATVSNTGETEGSYTVVLEIDGASRQEMVVTVLPGGTGNVVFSITLGTAGTYDINLGDLHSSFTVEEIEETLAPLAQVTPSITPTTTTPAAPIPSTPAVTPSSTQETVTAPDTQEGLAWWIIVLIILAVILFAGGSVMFFRHRRD